MFICQQNAPCFNCFGELIKELSEEFQPRGWLLSAAVSPTAFDDTNDIPQIAEYLDWISLMTYDYKENFDGLTRHHAPLYALDNGELSINHTVNYWIRNGVPSEKLILGIPSFGQSRNLVNAENFGLNVQTTGPGLVGPWTKTPGTLAYYEICSYTKTKGWNVVRDSEHRIGPYAYFEDQWVSYDDVDNVLAKGNYINRMNLAGGMIWTLDYDDFTNHCGCGNYPLLTALNVALHRIHGKTTSNCT